MGLLDDTVAPFVPRFGRKPPVSHDFFGGGTPTAEDRDRAHEHTPYKPREHELRPAPEPLWPSQSWWDQRGVMPSVQKRYGQIQSAGLSAIDTLGFGMPSAVLSRASPESFRHANDITKAHTEAKWGGLLGAQLLNPLNSVFRAGGNALANRGYGIAAQAGADAATVFGVNAASDVVRNGGPGLSTAVAAQAAPATILSRIFMPKLPSDMIERAAKGGAAGVVSGFPSLGMGDPSASLIGGISGALGGAGARPSARDANALRRSPLTTKADNAIAAHVGVGGLLSAANILSPGSTSETTIVDPDPNSAFNEWRATQHAPDLRMPRSRPAFPHETDYATPKYSSEVPLYFGGRR